jgi:gamma-glutamyltranspeptidase/glutathione hydrolase
MIALLRTAIVCLGLAALSASAAAAPASQSAPEAATGSTAKTVSHAKKFMIAAANPLAVDAGLEMLRAGGSAADAAVAVQLVLNLVEPQSSGLGGGAFVLFWDQARQALTAYDGRETAPAAARADRFLVNGRPRAFDEAVFGGLSVGVPGAPRLLEAIHKAHGRLPWKRLFEPALRLADNGFAISPRLSLLLRWYGPHSFAPTARDYFFDRHHRLHPAGTVLRNPAFAATLRALAERGADAFYGGPIAEAIVDAVRTAPNHQGDMTLADLAAYRVRERSTVCAPYRGRRICGMGPPSSGGIAVAQTLALLEPYDIALDPPRPMNARALHLIAEAEKLAFADRDFYVADPDFVPQPQKLLDPAYLAQRRRLIDEQRTMGRAYPGTPDPQAKVALGRDATVEAAGTSHISIIDADGNALAMTTTIESGFGSRLMAGGFLLNNELTDFAWRGRDREGRPVANAVAGGKRPRSSMAPTIVFGPDGKVEAVLGSPGGSRIIPYVVKSLVALIDWKMDAQAAAALMNFGSRGGPVEVEIDRPESLWHALRLTAYGHAINADLLTSGTHIIVRRPDGTLEGGADPRREGVARGD